MGNKKNPNYVTKAIEVTDLDTGIKTLYKAKRSSVALGEAKTNARKEVLDRLDKRFSARVLSVDEIMSLKNPKYIDLTGVPEVGPAQLDIEDAIAEAEAEAGECDGSYEQAEEREPVDGQVEGHGAIFQ